MEVATIWKYWSVQLWFRDETVVFIGIYFLEPLKLPDVMKISGFFPTQATTLSEFVQFLHRLNLEYNVDARLTFGDQKALRVGPTNASVVFDAVDDRLDSIRILAY